MDIGGEQLTAGITLFAAIGICISLFFEFINAFHDTANAVATVSAPCLPTDLPCRKVHRGHPHRLGPHVGRLLFPGRLDFCRHALSILQRLEMEMTSFSR
jgi:hypothetical protein